MNIKNISNKTKNKLVVAITLVVLILSTVFAAILIGRGEGSCSHLKTSIEESVEASEFQVGITVKKCKRCKEEIVEKTYATVDLPQLYLSGGLDGISKESRCFVEAEYREDESVTKTYATIKYQGHTSMSFEKKNYTIKFFEDAGESKKHKLSFNGWEPTNKYCLKANYIDYSMSRNIVSSHIWSEVVQSRKDLDENIAELEFYGGIDGYPVALFINDEYKGVYTFNIAKDEDTYKIADEENEAMFVINSAYSDAANFKALITEEDKKSIFDLEYAYPEDSDWAYGSINNLIQFVMDNDGATFVEGIDQYLDVDSAIDYLITAYVLGVTDNFAKNMILLTYDGQRWIPNMYDLDTACGLIFDGTGYANYDFCLPSINQDGVISSGTENLLWDRLLNNCLDRFMLRYFELRESILSTNSLEKKYSDFIDSIPLECYEEDLKLYPEIPYADISQKDQITAFLNLRCEALDEIFMAMYEVKK